MKYVSSLIFGLVCILNCPDLSAQYDIYSVERNGVNWIYPSSSSNNFGITALNPIDSAKCTEISNVLAGSEVLAHCRENIDSPFCFKKDVRDLGRLLAFGLDFSKSNNVKDIETGAVTTWEISSSDGQTLDPRLIKEYSAQLGIDPKNSAVGVVRPDGLRLAPKGEVPVFSFRKPSSVEHIGYSYSSLFQDGFEILQDHTIYVNQPLPTYPRFVFVSYILNCELDRGTNDFIDIKVDVRETGIRYQPPEVIDDAFKSYQQLAAKHVPADMSNEERSMWYGYHLAQTFSPDLVETIGLKNLSTLLFEQRGGKIALKQLTNKGEFNDAISTIGTHVNRNQMIRLSKAL